MGAIVVIVAVGAFWYQDYLRYKPAEPVAEVTESEFLTMVDRGLTDEVKANLEQTITELEASIAEQGDEPDVHDLLLLGNAYYTYGQLAEAKDAYARILLQNPNDVPALENLGTTLYDMEDYYGAEEAWIAATELGGSEGHVLRLADLIEDHIPEHRELIGEMLKVAIEEFGQTPGLLARLGEWYFDRGDYTRAVSHYEVAIDLDPDNEVLSERLLEIRDAWTEATSN